MKATYLILAVLLIASCTQTNNSDGPSITGTEFSFKVEYIGELKKIMHEGDLSAKADLTDLENSENLYAIGASENLRGEIQIFNSTVYNTFVQDSVIQFDMTYNSKAALIVYAQVKEWQSFEVPADVVTKDQLESFITQTADSYGIDIHSPFPFILDGNAASISWHIINWPEGDTIHSHEKHIQSGLHGVLKKTDASFLGFYSDAHHTIFTHHTTNMHIHVRTKDNMVAGHVDDLELGKGMTLELPRL